MLSRLPFLVDVIHPHHIPAAGPCVLITNHYSRAGFYTWWLAFSIAAQIPKEIHFIVTSAWTYTIPWQRLLIMPVVKWFIQQMTAAYNFLPMTPIPPYSNDIADRAASVRKILQFARANPTAIIALAPEGHNSPGNVLGAPPAGAGRFLAQLQAEGYAFIPVGFWESAQAAFVRFGPAFTLENNPALSSSQADAFAATQVMKKLAAVLPESLRGIYA